MTSPTRPRPLKRRKYDARAALTAPFKPPFRLTSPTASDPRATLTLSASRASHSTSALVKTEGKVLDKSKGTGSLKLASMVQGAPKFAPRRPHDDQNDDVPASNKEASFSRLNVTTWPSGLTTTRPSKSHRSKGPQFSPSLCKKMLVTESSTFPSPPKHRQPDPSLLVSRHCPSPPSEQPSHLRDLRKRYASLLTRNTSLRSSLEAVRQAVRIQASPHDAELERLISVWREASRAAAEDLFVVAREKVDRMGGVQGWKENEKGRRERLVEWDQAELQNAGVDGDISEGEKEQLRAEREGFTDLGDYRHTENDEAWEEADDKGHFTMDMMLRSMNIDLGLIGYNKELQKWEE